MAWTRCLTAVAMLTTVAMLAAVAVLTAASLPPSSDGLLKPIHTPWAHEHDVVRLLTCGNGSSCGQVERSLLEELDGSSELATSVWPLFRDLDLLLLLQEGSADQRGPPGPAGRPGVQRCRRDLRKYLHGLENFSLWAMQLWDASVRAPRGSLWGELSHLGNFDQCMAAGEESGRGSTYCLATLEIRPDGRETPQEERARGTAWQRIKPATQRFQVSRHRSQWGLCLPASCGEDAVAAVLGEPLATRAARFNLSASLAAGPYSCQGSPGSPDLPDSAQHHAAAAAFWTAVSVYMAWLAFCSAIDASGLHNSGRGVVGTFSLQRHWRALFSSTSSTATGEIQSVYGLRVLTIATVIMGHRGEALMAAPIINRGDVEQIYYNLLDIIILNASTVVDVFFVVGGCLMSWTLLGYHQKNESPSLTKAFLQRYLRLTPAYAVAIAYLALALPSLGSGPLWKAVALEQAERCQQRWWANILYIGNLVRPDKPCLDPGWYLTCDLQLFLPGVLLARRLHDNRHRVAAAVRLLGLALLVAVLYPAAVTLLLGLQGTVVPVPETLGDLAATPEHMHLYVSTPCRAGPYILGIAAGWYLRTRSDNKLPPACVWLDALMPALVLGPPMLGVLFYPPLDAVTPRLAHAAYAGLHRIPLAAVIAYIIIVSSSEKHDSAVARALSSPSLKPLGRLSYCVFLTHYIVQIHFLGLQRTPAYYSTIDAVNLSIQDMVWSTLSALVLHLTVEAPFSTLLRRNKSIKEQ